MYCQLRTGGWGLLDLGFAGRNCCGHNGHVGIHCHSHVIDGHGYQHNTCHFGIVWLDASVAGQEGEVACIWYGSCDLVVVHSCSRLHSCCCLQCFSDKDDVGAGAWFHCCTGLGESIDDAAHGCSHQADDGGCLGNVHIGLGCGSGYDENDMSV